jgi:hypothetical protein
MNKNSRVEKKREEDELVCKACRQAIGFIWYVRKRSVVIKDKLRLD